MSKRYYIAGDAPFAPSAVWRALLMFTLNFDGSDEKTRAFLRLLLVLNECLMATGSKALHETADLLARAQTELQRYASTLRVTQRALFNVIALGNAGAARAIPLTLSERDAYLDDLYGRVVVAAAGVCMNGVCS